MDLEITSASAADWPEVRALLERSSLPLAGAQDQLGAFLVAKRDGRVVGCVAIEPYGRYGLLRSVAVDARTRGSRVGERLVGAAFHRALETGVRSLILLTTTAADYFPRFGFRRIERQDAPPEVHASAEFQGACPASATVMRLDLVSDH